MQKTKICFVIPRAYEYFFPGVKPVGGGAEKQCFLLASEISKNEDFELHFCLADYGQESHFVNENINFWRIHKLTDNKLIAIRIITKTLQKVQADIYIFRSANSAILPISIYIKTILKKKVLYMMSSDSEIDFASLKKKSGFLTALFMKFTHKYVDLLTVQNNNQLIKLQKQRKGKKTALIPNAIASKKISSASSNMGNILWVGRLVPVKQPEIYLELAKRFPNQNFEMIAPDVPEYKNYALSLKKEIAKLSNLQYIEYLDKNEILNHYQKAGIYIITSEKEGFSNTMMEAMAFKCAVLSLNVSPNDIFNEKQVGICVNGDIELFFNYFEQLSNKKEFAENLGNNAQKYIFKKYNLKEASSLFIDFVKKGI